MKLIALFCLLTSPVTWSAEAKLHLIPQPNEMHILPGKYTLPSPLIIESGENELFTALSSRFPAHLKARLWKQEDGKTLHLTTRFDSSLRDRLGTEGYQLQVDQYGLHVVAASKPGIFYGTQTLLQLIRQAENNQIPHLTITDSPRFGWRGLMLDEARHFMGKAYVKHLLRTMAAHKMNRFHWHLSDDQGWRIEIKKYPKLTSVGAWRGPGTSGPVPKYDQDSPLAHQKYGGFHTQEDIKEIVAYAKSLHIEIIPEIDVPGHAMAIALSYPEVLPKQDGDTGKGVHGLKGNVLSVVREENYQMLNDIFGEIAALFPNQYIHVGGDEVNVNAWNASPEHRAFMKKNGMTNAHQLQNMFMLRLETILKGHGKTLLGWNEIMHGGKLSKDTGVMAWISIGAGLNAARQGYPTVMAVGPHNYFDMKYPGPGETGHWWAGIVDTKRAYSWNPLFEGQLTADQQKNILGVHCALWTEFVPDPANADYKLWPRACATAEVGWSRQEQRKWDDFSTRLSSHLDYLDTLKVGYRVKPPQAVVSQGEITIQPPYNAPARIVFTLDGTEPTAQSTLYSGQPLSSEQAAKLRYRTLRPDGRMSKVVTGAIQEPLGHWDANTLGKGSATLTFDVTNILTNAGSWVLECQYQGGKNGTRIHAARLLENGSVIASANGKPIHSKDRNARLRLPVQALHNGASYTLEVNLEGDGGHDSRGSILLDRSVWSEPETTVTTQVSHYGSNTADKAANWVRSDWFWSDRKGEKGDQWLYRFAKPVTVTSIDIPTGKPNTNDDIIVDGDIEVSTDGTTFQKAGFFTFGTGIVRFTKPTTIQALRITLGNDHQTWIILRDLQIK